VQVNDLPSGCLLLQDDRAAIQESRTIVEMEGDNRDISGDLKMKIPRLDVHIRCLRSARANAVEHLLKRLLKFLASVGTMREFARIEDRSIVGESSAEAIPVKIVECLNEIGERLADFGFGVLWGARISVHAHQQYEDQKRCTSSFHRDAV
jgi:hypothetical protein